MNPVFSLAISAGPSCLLGIPHIGSARKNKFFTEQVFFGQDNWMLAFVIFLHFY